MLLFIEISSSDKERSGRKRQAKGAKRAQVAQRVFIYRLCISCRWRIGWTYAYVEEEMVNKFIMQFENARKNATKIQKIGQKFDKNTKLGQKFDKMRIFISKVCLDTISWISYFWHAVIYIPLECSCVQNRFPFPLSHPFSASLGLFPLNVYRVNSKIASMPLRNGYVFHVCLTAFNRLFIFRYPSQVCQSAEAANVAIPSKMKKSEVNLRSVSEWDE
jgi:hypothetical protein